MLKILILFACLISTALCAAKSLVLPEANVIPDWNNDTHWSPQGVPTENDDITVSGINNLEVPSGITIKSLVVDGSSLIFSGDVNVSESISFVGNSAVIDVDGAIHGTGTITGGTIKVQSNGSIHLPATGTKVNFSPPGGFVAKLIDPPPDGGIKGDASIGELYLGLNLGVPIDVRVHEEIYVDTLVVTAAITSYINITVNQEFDVNHTIELRGNTTFKSGVRFGSGLLNVNDCVLTIEGTTTQIAPSLQLGSTKAAIINFYGDVDIDTSDSTDLGSGTVNFGASVNGIIRSNNAIFNFLTNSVTLPDSSFYAEQVNLQGSTTYSTIGAATSVNVQATGVTIYELNAPPTLTISNDVTVGSFWAKELTPLTISGAHLITVTGAFNVSSSEFTSEANITLLEGVSGVFNNEQVTITLSTGYFTNRGLLKFVGGADILLGSDIDFVNYGTITFSATATSVVTFNSETVDTTPGKFVNLGLVITNGNIQLFLNYSVSYYQCENGEFEIEPTVADGLGFAYFSYEAVLLGKIVVDFQSEDVLNTTTPGLVFAKWARSQKLPPVGNAALKVEVATQISAVAALCLDPVSDPDLTNGFVSLKVYNKNAPASGTDTCQSFKSDIIPSSRYCPAAPEPAGQSPQPNGTNPPSTTAPVNPPQANPPSSASVIGVTASLVLMAMNLVF